MRAHAYALLAAVVPASACAHDLTAGPGAAPEAVGPPVSSYSIAIEDGRIAGDVHVISFGVERLPTGPSAPQLYLHLRLAAVNATDTARWSFDPNEQRLLASGHAAPPSFAETSDGDPVLALARGRRGYMDVYYPVPPAERGAVVTLAWRLQRGSKTAAMTTSFARTGGPDTSYVYYQPAPGPHVYFGLGFDCWWWSDYYFWRHGSLWWPYPRAYYYRRYQGAGDAAFAQRHEEARRPARSSSSDDWHRFEPTSSWRGGSADGSSDGKSAWRGGSSDGGGQSASGGGGDGSGKSAWRSGR